MQRSTYGSVSSLLMILLWIMIGAALIAPPRLYGFELLEVDGDEIAGNSPVLLGWRDQDQPLSWAIIEGNVPVPGMPTHQWIEIVARSFMTWSSVPGTYLRFRPADGYGVTGGVAPMVSTSEAYRFSPFRSLSHGRRGPPHDDGLHNMVVVVHEGWQESFGFSSDALAITEYGFTANDRHMVGADIFLNADTTRYRWGIVDPYAVDRELFDIENTLVHEIGHFIGLAHPYAPGRETSTMWHQAQPGETHKRFLTDDDMNGVRYLYPLPGVPLIPPDTPGIGLRILDNPEGGGGGCLIGPRKPCRRPFVSHGLTLILPLLVLLAPAFRRRRAKDQYS